MSGSGEVSLEDILKIIERYEVVELEDVRIKGDVEIELGTVIAPIIQAFQQQQQQLQVRGEAAPELVEASFEVGKAEWNGEIEEVTIGATAADGGTRERTVTIGGEKALPFYNFDHPMPHPPVISVDCFDLSLIHISEPTRRS